MKTSSTRKLLAIPVAVATLALAACSSTPSNSGTNADYNIVFISGVTGLLQQNVQATEGGINAAVANLNAKGGVNGHKVKVTYLDDKSDPTQAVSVLNQYLASHDKPNVVIPGLISDEALALAPILQRDGILAMGAFQNPTLDDPAKYPHLFSNSAKSTLTADAAAQFLQSKGAKKVALVTPNDALLQSDQPALSAALSKVGITLTVDSFAADATSTTSAFAKAKASGADWIYADAVGATVPLLLQGRLQAGADSIPTIGGSSVTSGSFLTVTTAAQRNNVYCVLYPMTAYIPPASRSAALKALISRIGDPSKLPLPLNNYAYGWDDVSIWAAGAEQAKSVDVTKISSALQNLKQSGTHSTDRPWIIWDKLWSSTTHFVQGQTSELTIATVQSSPKDGMIVPNS